MRGLDVRAFFISQLWHPTVLGLGICGHYHGYISDRQVLSLSTILDLCSNVAAFLKVINGNESFS